MSSASGHPSPTLFKMVYRVPETAEQSFQAALSAMLAAAEQSTGYAGSDVIKPEPGTKKPEWQALLRFETEGDLRRWRESPKTRKSAARVDALTVGAPKVERIHGLEAWFTLPDRREVSPPPKWKMAIVSSISIYPLILLIPPQLEPVIGELPEALSTLVQLVIIIPIMNWIVIPLVTRLLRPWLYRAGPEDPTAGVARSISTGDVVEHGHHGARGLAPAGG